MLALTLSVSHPHPGSPPTPPPPAGNTAANGYYLDEGIAQACHSQTGCASDDTSQACLPNGYLPNSLKCLTPQAGYELDAAGIVSGKANP